MSRSMVVFFGCVACGTATGDVASVAPLPDDVVAAAQTRIASLHARGAELAAIGTTIDPQVVVPRPDLGACPVQLPRLAFSATASPSLTDLVEGSSYPLAIVRNRESLPRPGAVAAGEVDALVGAMTAELQRRPTSEQDRRDEIDRIERAIALPDPDTAVVFLADRWQDASFDTHASHLDKVAAALGTSESFEPGAVSGRAYLWSATTRTIVCAADVEATSSPNLSIPFGNGPSDQPDRNIGAALDADLRARLAEVISSAMQSAAGPPPSTPARRSRRP